MPELPEAEYAARQLRAWMVGRVVRRAFAERSNVLRGHSPQRLAQALRGRRLEEVERRGKYLLLGFDEDAGVLLHLGMTGKLVHLPVGSALEYSRAHLELDDGLAVHLRDPRKFGRLMLCPRRALLRLPEIAAMGPDALQDAPTAASLGARLGKSRRPIKPALLDQQVIGGLGNVQAAEALFRAGISPLRLARDLRAVELERLAQAVRDSIAHTLAGMPPLDQGLEYVEEGGENPFLVYGRAGERCPRCGGTLRSIVQAARTTHYCPRCQR